MSLKKAMDKLGAAVGDLSSLHVKTYSGTVDLVVDGAADGSKAKSIEQMIQTKDGNVKLMLETLINFDGDSFNFVADSATAEHKVAHKDAIEAGIKTRQAIVEMLKGWLPK